MQKLTHRLPLYLFLFIFSLSLFNFLPVAEAFTGPGYDLCAYPNEPGMGKPAPATLSGYTSPQGNILTWNLVPDRNCNRIIRRVGDDPSGQIIPWYGSCGTWQKQYGVNQKNINASPTGVLPSPVCDDINVSTFTDTDIIPGVHYWYSYGSDREVYSNNLLLIPTQVPNGSYPTPAYTYPTPAYVYPTPAYTYPTPAYVYPTPAYTYPTPTYIYPYPTPVYTYPTPAYTYPTPSGPSVATATFVRVDTSTGGAWNNKYGSDGYKLAGDATNLTRSPSYASVSLTNHLSYTWASLTTNANSLQKPGSTERFASTWYNYPTFNVSANLSDTQTHQVSLYVSDFDSIGRAEKIEVLDAATGNILDTETTGAFGGGKYFIWNVKGSVIFKITATNSINAVSEGIFFDPVGGSTGGGGDTTAPTVGVTTPLGSATVSGTTTITATASDATGVTKVEFYVDGNLKGSDTSSPYSFSWDTTNGGAHACIGPHTHYLTAKAYDAAGNVGTSAGTTVNMNNPDYCAPTYTYPTPSTGTNICAYPRATGTVKPEAPTVTVGPGVSGNVVRWNLVPNQNCNWVVRHSSVDNFFAGVSVCGTIYSQYGVPGTRDNSSTACDDQSLNMWVDTNVVPGVTYYYNVYSDRESNGRSENITVPTSYAYPTPYPTPSVYPTPVYLYPTPSVYQTPAGGVGENLLVSPTDTIHNFADVKYAEGKNIVDVPGSGNWSTLVTGDVSDSVVILHGNVLFDAPSASAYTVAVYPGGNLHFATNQSTELKVVNLMVAEGGTLTLGTSSDPVLSSAKAQITIRDVPLSPAIDPGQYGHGLIVLGKVVMHGQTLNDTFVRVAREPKAGDLTLSLEKAVTGWRAGDKLVIADTRQLTENDFTSFSASNVRTAKNPQWEEMSIQSISNDGKTISLSSALQYDHLGGRDQNGTLTFLPHVGNLGRNVIIKSENPNGYRGHTMYLHMAQVDIEYALFKDLGRTTASPLDSAVLDSNGDGSRAGGNQIGRYALHLHHAMGPMGSSDAYQYRLIGNAIDSPTKWGIALHDSHYGLVSGNVIYNSQGSGLTTETGNETGNVIENNFALRTNGSGQGVEDRAAATATDFGHEGAGFWFHGSHNTIRGNVAANNREAGILLYQVLAPGNPNPVRFPLFRGADTVGGHAGVDYTVDYTDNVRPTDFSNNEVYGEYNNGFELWNMFDRENKQGAYVIKNPSVWNTSSVAFLAKKSDKVEVDNLKVRGNGNGFGFVGIESYLTIDNADIQGEAVGATSGSTLTPPAEIETTIKNSYFRNIKNIVSNNYHSGNTGASLTTIKNTKFDPVGGQPLSAIERHWVAGDTVNLLLPDRMIVDDYNKVSGNDFEVFYLEQSPNVVIPAAAGTPYTGLTNAATWQKFGKAIGGGISPTTDRSTHPEIAGFTADSATINNNPPVIASIQSIDVASGSATITWSTNKGATDKLDYGLDSNYGQSQTSEALTLNHSIKIKGLKYATTYHFKITSKDSNNRSASSIEDLDVITLPKPVTPPKVNSVSVTPGSVNLAWDEPDEYYQGILIMRSTSGFIATPNASTALVNLPAPATSYHDQNVSPSTTYYYSLFTYDDTPTYSLPVNVQFTTPADSPTVDSPSHRGGGGGGGGGYAYPSPYLTPMMGNQIPGCDNRTTGFSTVNGASCMNNVVSGGTGSPSYYNFGSVTLRNGSRGEAVKELQRYLNRYLNLGLKVDGILGPKTIAVIKVWQKNHSLVADGLIGPKTKAMMNSLVR